MIDGWMQCVSEDGDGEVVVVVVVVVVRITPFCEVLLLGDEAGTTTGGTITAST